jgi:hypothetical protein
MNEDYYKGLGKIYFKKIIIEIIKIGELRNSEKKILDYGCGFKYLEKILKIKILNYDIEQNHSEIKQIDKHQFDIVVLNHVLMYMSEKQIRELFIKIKLMQNNCEFIIGIGRMSLINKLASIISFNFNAHAGTKTSPDIQIKIMLEYFEIIKKKSIFFMTDVFYLKFKKD